MINLLLEKINRKHGPTVEYFHQVSWNKEKKEVEESWELLIEEWGTSFSSWLDCWEWLNKYAELVEDREWV